MPATSTTYTVIYRYCGVHRRAQERARREARRAADG